MLHCVIGVAAGLRPVRVDHRLRQGDGDLGKRRIGFEPAFKTENGDPLTRQRLLFAGEPAAPGEPDADEYKRDDKTKHSIEKMTYWARAAVISAARARKLRGAARSSASCL